MTKKYKVLFTKHGDVINEIESIIKSNRIEIFDSVVPYIVEMYNVVEKENAVFIGLTDNNSSNETDKFLLKNINSERASNRLFSMLNKGLCEVKILFTLISSKPEFVIPTGRFFQIFVPYVYSIFSNCKITIVIKGDIDWELENPAKKLLFHFFKLIVNSNRIVKIYCRSKKPYEDLEENGVDPLKITVFEPYYPPSFFKFNKISETFENSNEMIFIGRFQGEKGVLDLVEIAKYLSSNIDFRINLIGWGIQETELKQKIKDHDLSKYFRFLGSKKPTEIYSYLKQVKLTLIPSYAEGACKVSIESILAETPVIAYDTGSIKYNVIDNETGYIVETGNKNEFADRVLCLLEDSEKYQKFMNNTKNHRERLSNPEITFEKAIKDFILT